MTRLALAAILALWIAAPAAGQGIRWTDSQVRVTAGTGAGKSLAQAISDGDLSGGGGVPPRSATDCTAETGGVSGEICADTDNDAFYVCESAPCNGAGWDGPYGGGSATWRTAATDCTAETGGVLGEICAELDDNAFYVCETAPCNGTGWVAYGGSTATILDQAAGEVDLRYDPAANVYYFDEDDSDTRTDGDHSVPNQVFYAIDYQQGATTTGGIEEAINAACTAGGGIVEVPRGTTNTTGTINLDCDYLILQGHGAGSSISFGTVTTGILMTGDNVLVRNLEVRAAAANAANVGIDMDNDAATVSGWHLQDVRIIGNTDTGVGVRCNGCLKGALTGGTSHISDWDIGVELNVDTGVYPNANVVSDATIRSNGDAGIDVTALQGPLTISGIVFESQPTGVRCVSSGTGTIVSTGSYFEAHTTAAYHRPASGCGFQTFGDRLSSSGNPYFLKESTGASDDALYGAYFSGTGSISNAMAEPVHLYHPANLGSLSCNDANCVIHRYNDRIVMEGATEDGFETILAFTDPTSSDKTFTFGDDGGNVCTDTNGACDTIYEEEAQIGTTDVTGNAVDNGTLVGTGASAAAWVTLPSCSDEAETLGWNTTTGAWVCNADAGAGGGMTSWTLAGTSGTPQTITDGNTATIAAGNGISTTAGATDTVTVAGVADPTPATITVGAAGFSVAADSLDRAELTAAFETDLDNAVAIDEDADGNPEVGANGTTITFDPNSDSTNTAGLGANYFGMTGGQFCPNDITGAFGPCLSYDSGASDRLFHDTDGDGVKDAGEEYIDLVDTDTNANTICTGTTTYLDGEGNCDDISSVYAAAAHGHTEDAITVSQTDVFVGRDTAGGGTAEEITMTAARTMLNVVTGAHSTECSTGSCSLNASTTHNGNTIRTRADKETECFAMHAPNAKINSTDSVDSVWRAPAAITVTEIWCETVGTTVTLNLENDDGTPGDISTSDIVCDTNGELSAGLSGTEDDVADGSTINLAITSVGAADTATRLTVCMEYTRQ